VLCLSGRDSGHEEERRTLEEEYHRVFA
jgi:hypothetical protein